RRTELFCILVEIAIRLGGIFKGVPGSSHPREYIGNQPGAQRSVKDRPCRGKLPRIRLESSQPGAHNQGAADFEASLPRLPLQVLDAISEALSRPHNHHMKLALQRRRCAVTSLAQSVCRHACWLKLRVQVFHEGFRRSGMDDNCLTDAEPMWKLREPLAHMAKP